LLVRKLILMQAITSFQGEHRFLSNFWPCTIAWEGLVYPSLEHAYAASRTDDASAKMMICSCSTPGEAKEWLTAKVVEPSASWTIPKKLRVMEELLFLKFGGKEPLLTRALMATGKAELIEGNTWNDTFWGVCNGVGENNLGRLLMKVRESLFNEKKHIEENLSSTNTHQELSDATGLSRLALYEKMMAFDIPQKKYLGY